MNIAEAPTGINVVVETERTIYIGRFGSLEGDRVRMHHAVVFQVHPSQNTEDLIRETATYGVPVAHRELEFDAKGIRRVRKLGDVPKA